MIFIEHCFIDQTNEQPVECFMVPDNLSIFETDKIYKSILKLASRYIKRGQNIRMLSEFFEPPADITLRKTTAMAIFEEGMNKLNYKKKTKEVLRYFNDKKSQKWICSEMLKEHGEIQRLKQNAIIKANKRNPQLKKPLIFIEDLINFLNTPS